jgi:hypothetical protein
MNQSYPIVAITLSLVLLSGCGSTEEGRPTEAAEEDLTQPTIKRAFEQAFSAAGDPNESRTSSVELSKVPVPARRAMQVETRRIARLTTDTYGAEVQGYYIVHTTPSKRSVAGYAVLAWGAGEPDYQNYILTGFDAQGKVVFTKSESY